VNAAASPLFHSLIIAAPEAKFRKRTCVKIMQENVDI